MTEDTKYDVVIVGSGLGGLACGSMLSQKGYKVCILEKHYQIGGCLQNFKRKGRLFDTGMHYIGSYGESEILNKLFRYFGIYDKIIAKKLNPEGFDSLTFGDETFNYPEGIENFKNALIEKFPAEKKGVEKYFAKINEITNSVDILNLREVDEFNMGVKEGMDINVHDFISSVTENTSLQNILAGLNSLYAGEKKTAPLYIHAIITSFFLRSAWRLTGGGGQVAKAFKTVIKSNGGTIKTRANVVQFLTQEKKITKVQLDDDSEIEGKLFISNIHPATTMEMVEAGMFRKVYINRLKKLKNTISTFSLYIVLKDKSFEYINFNTYYYKQKDVWGLTNYSEEEWPGGFMLYTAESKKYPGYAESITVLSPMRYEEMQAWENTAIEERGEDYDNMKNQKAEKLLDVVNEKFPDIREHIEEYFTSTPLTYRDYTGTKEGSMYGVVHDCNSPLESIIMPKTKVENLYLTGQNTNLHGVLGVSLGAVLTCGEILGLNKIIAEIRDGKA